MRAPAPPHVHLGVRFREKPGARVRVHVDMNTGGCRGQARHLRCADRSLTGPSSRAPWRVAQAARGAGAGSSSLSRPPRARSLGGTPCIVLHACTLDPPDPTHAHTTHACMRLRDPRGRTHAYVLSVRTTGVRTERTCTPAQPVYVSPRGWLTEELATMRAPRM